MYISRRFYIACLIIITFFLCGYVFAAFFVAGKWLAAALLLLAAFAGWLLWKKKEGIHASRICLPRFSNGDENPGEHKDIIYRLRPVKRGEYTFGHIRLFAATYRFACAPLYLLSAVRRQGVSFVPDAAPV